MKNKDFAGLARQLLTDLPGFFVKGPMAAIRPITHALRGLYFEGSSFDKNSLYVWAFLLPLFVPTDRVSFNLGKRVRGSNGGDRWNMDAPNLLVDLRAAVEHEALPFLLGINSVEDIARAATALRKDRDPYVQQAIAFSWTLAGDVARGVEELDRLIHMLDVKIPWQGVMSERAEALKAKLLASPRDAIHQLKVWEQESVRNLGLIRFSE